MQGNIYTFEPTPKQFKAWTYLTDNITSELGYGGGAGGGKSWIGTFWLASMCEAYAGVRYMIGRRELKNLKRTTLVTFFKMAEFYGWKIGVDYEYSSFEGIIRWWNGSEILLVDLAYSPQDPLYLRLGGLELTGGFVDESNEVQITAINILKTRIGRCCNKEYNLLPKLFETFNPNKEHVYYRYYKPFKDNTMPADRQFIPALPTDNPHLPQSYIEQLKKADPVTRARLLEGSFEYDDDPSKLIEYDDITDLFTNRAEVSEEKYLSVDVARFGKDKTVIFYWKGLQVKKIYMFDRTSVSKTIEILEYLTEKLQIKRSHVIVDEDGVGGGVVDGFKGCKGFVNNSKPIQPKGAKKNELKRLNYMNLKTQCYFKLAELIKEGKIGISEITPELKEMLVSELEQVKQKDIDKDNRISLVPKDVVKDIIGRSPDLSDAMMMRMYFEIKKQVVLKPYFA